VSAGVTGRAVFPAAISTLLGPVRRAPLVPRRRRGSWAAMGRWAVHGHGRLTAWQVSLRVAQRSRAEQANDAGDQRLARVRLVVTKLAEQVRAPLGREPSALIWPRVDRPHGQTDCLPPECEQQNRAKLICCGTQVPPARWTSRVPPMDLACTWVRGRESSSCTIG
jgi:hypothetical protein